MPGSSLGEGLLFILQAAEWDERVKWIGRRRQSHGQHRQCQPPTPLAMRAASSSTGPAQASREVGSQRSSGRNCRLRVRWPSLGAMEQTRAGRPTEAGARVGRTCVPTVQLPCRTGKEENARPSGKTPHLWVRLNRLLVWLGREGGPQPRWRRLVGIEVGVAMASVSIEAGGRGRGQGKPTAVSTNSRCSGF